MKSLLLLLRLAIGQVAEGTRVFTRLAPLTTRKGFVDHHRVAYLNKLLADELGLSPTGLALFKWIHSDSWLRSKRRLREKEDGTLEGEYEYIQNPETKLFYAIPTYVQCKVVEEAHDQWMMGVWMDNGSFDGFRRMYGDNLEWNKAGEYWPVTVDRPTGGVIYVSMAPGKLPTTDDTWKFIHVRRKDLRTLDEYEAGMERIRKSLQKSEHDKLTGMILDRLPARFGIPGSRAFSHEIGIGQKQMDGTTVFERNN